MKKLEEIKLKKKKKNGASSWKDLHVYRKGEDAQIRYHVAIQEQIILTVVQKWEL